MASLYIKDAQTADLVARVARRAGVTKTALVKEMAAAREAELDRAQRRDGLRARLDALHAANPLPERRGPPADKAFFDEMWGEDSE